MNFLIIGYGSIGKRHEKNLISLGHTTVNVDIDQIDNINFIINSNKFDGCFVCTPNILHAEHVSIAIKNQLPVFCEKPFVCTISKEIENLIEDCKANNIINMVGCNLRFTPEVEKINPQAKYISVYCGYNLKNWRPSTNHLKSYSANKNLGGGILLDSIHELDYLCYKFGKIKCINFIKDKISDITNDTEDLVTGRIYFENDTIADFTLNYLCEQYERYYDILNDDCLYRTHFNINNEMYIKEVEYFINSIKIKSECMNNFEEAYDLTKRIL